MVSINLNGKAAIVTGAAGGLGKAIALKLAEAGCSVGIAYRSNDEGALKTAEEIRKMGAASKVFKVDTVKEKEVFNLVDAAVKEFGRLDIMVNNAGIGLMKPILDLTQQEIDNLIDIDLKGTINGCRAALKHMIPQKEGKIVNISSIAAKMGAPQAAIYAAAKAGIIALTNSLAREVAQDNININAVSPGIIRTNMWEKQLDLMTNSGDEKVKDEAFKSFSGSQIPLKRPQEPNDIANMVLFLVSDLAQNITGQNINVDGGSVIY
ncbi:SDR family NAD(P)-dependent oxidoreductase [Lutispora saccharofermentans]|uniref:SDR family oxidoreductase n=1 Tax=Lutispora saccharofermentans TaxID=3024236 RepID=A0ABT1NDI5_9FIRM|nr:SDR family NAD(P)-dependent oxidoreductase [Lutispora saccharofermentans]MCQ1529320.1 SDR family oxidoreductase [Lutispora saccharofermentans]